MTLTFRQVVSSRPLIDPGQPDRGWHLISRASGFGADQALASLMGQLLRNITVYQKSYGLTFTKLG